jgi:hypothetical protein
MKKLIRFASMCTCAAALLVTPAIADEPAKPATPSMDEKAMMDAWMEMAKLNENHKLLGSMVGTWEYKMQCWMGPEPKTTKGTAKHVAIMDGRFIHSEHDGEMLMPGPDGKDVTKPFHGASVTGYDNVKGKFVSVWMDNMSTGFTLSEGTYDPASKTFSYTGEMSDPTNPEKKAKYRYTIVIKDNDHHTFTWYDIQNGQEMKTMEMEYTRK